VALLNFAEFLVSQKRIEEGISAVTDSIKILRVHHKDDTFLAAGLSNYAGYLTAINRYEEARVPCSEALKIFVKELGKFNDYTRSAFANMYQILQKLELHDAITDLETDWKTVDKANVQGLSDQDITDMTEQFIHTIKQAEPKANPPGPTKGPKLYKRQLNEFFGDWEQRDPTPGHDITDPAISPVIQQEMEAIKMGMETRKELNDNLKKKREKIIADRYAGADREASYYKKKDQLDRKRNEWQIFSKEHRYTKELLEQLDIDEDEDTARAPNTETTEKQEKELREEEEELGEDDEEGEEGEDLEDMEDMDDMDDLDPLDEGSLGKL